MSQLCGQFLHFSLVGMMMSIFGAKWRFLFLIFKSGPYGNHTLRLAKGYCLKSFSKHLHIIYLSIQYVNKSNSSENLLYISELILNIIVSMSLIKIDKIFYVDWIFVPSCCINLFEESRHTYVKEDNLIVACRVSNELKNRKNNGYDFLWKTGFQDFVSPWRLMM